MNIPKESVVFRNGIGLNKRISRGTPEEVIHFCNLQLIETVPDVLQEKHLSRQMTDKSVFDVTICI